MCCVETIHMCYSEANIHLYYYYSFKIVIFQLLCMKYMLNFRHFVFRK